MGIKGAGLPDWVYSLIAKHADMARRWLRKKELKERARVHEKYVQELAMWQDIDQALHLLDPTSHNPAPKPQLPEHKKMAPVVEGAAVSRIIRQVRHWFDENKDALRIKPGTAALSREQSELGTAAIGSIVRTVLLHR